MIPVAANDVAFSAHAVLLTVLTLSQIVIYDVSGDVPQLVHVFLTVFKIFVFVYLYKIMVCDLSSIVSIG